MIALYVVLAVLFGPVLVAALIVETQIWYEFLSHLAAESIYNLKDWLDSRKS